MKLFSLLETQYYNFSTAIKSYLSKTLSDYDEKYGNSTIFGQLINVLGAVVQNVMLYIEDALVEQNKWTAQRRKSIYGLATQTGYEPSFGKASGVQLKFTFTPTNQQSLFIMFILSQRQTCHASICAIDIARHNRVFGLLSHSNLPQPRCLSATIPPPMLALRLQREWRNPAATPDWQSS